MAKKKSDNYPTYSRKLALMYLATIGLAALAIVLEVESPVVWTFLGLALGHLFGRGSK